jgi:hypothetical protein
MATSSSTATSSSLEKPLSRFDLPGLNLPLNWQPTYNRNDDSTACKGKVLFKTALNEKDIDDGVIS